MDNNTEQPQGRVNPTTSAPPNPAKFFAEWSSTNECFMIYNKETKKKEPIPLPFTFIPLERCICLKGYNDDEKTSYISNEVKSSREMTSTEVFHIRAYNNVTKKSNLVLSGTWDVINKQAKAMGADWTESIYIAYKNKANKLELANVQLNGSGITHWFDFLKSTDVWSNAVTIKEFTKEKKGINNYNAPKFSAVKIKKETDIEAAVLQKQILAYLSEYYTRSGVQSTEVSKVPINEQKETNKEIAFDNSKHKDAQKSEVIDTTPDIVYGNDDVPEF